VHLSSIKYNHLIFYKTSQSSFVIQLTMPRFEVLRSAKLNLTSYSGLALIGQCFDAAQADAMIDPLLPVSQGMKNSDMVKAMTGLLSLDKSDFEAIEPRFKKTASSRRGSEPDEGDQQRLNASADGHQGRGSRHLQGNSSGQAGSLLNLAVERAWWKKKHTLRLIVEVTERTIDKKGQHLLMPQGELQGWWASLTLPATEVIEHYRYHGVHEQFHLEIKTDLELERLPLGKFAFNNAILGLGAFADNCLLLIGQLGLNCEITPIRHPAKRRRLKTVLQEIMYRAAKFVEHVRKLGLDFGRNFAGHDRVLVGLQDLLLRAASP